MLGEEQFVSLPPELFCLSDIKLSLYGKTADTDAEGGHAPNATIITRRHVVLTSTHLLC